MIRLLTAAVVSGAVVMSSLEMPHAAEAKRPIANAERDAAMTHDTAFITRQEKMWGRLSASICSGCITTANRVAPVSYEKPGSAPITEAKIETVKTAVRKAAPPRRYARLQARYAQHHRRDRLRLAARARLRAAALAKRRALRFAALKRHRHASLRATFVPAYEARSVNVVYRVPADMPFTPRDDGRWRETILPTTLRLRRS